MTSDLEPELAAGVFHALADVVLLELKPKQREILTRYYVLGEPEERICRAMGLTTTQFRQAKWRAKGRFALLLEGNCGVPCPFPKTVPRSKSRPGARVS